MLKLHGKNTVSYGQFLKETRKAARLSQEKLAERISARGWSVTAANISMIEREYDRTKAGTPTRPRKEFVILAAEVCGVDVDKALVEADYAPKQPTGPPQNPKELIEALDKLGVDQIEFHSDITDFTPDQLQELLDNIRVVVEMTLTKQGRK